MNDVELPRILAIVDRPGWAIDKKASCLARHLADRYRFIVRYQHEVDEDDLKAADLIVIFYWLELLKMPLSEAVLARFSDRLLMGICSHYELDGLLREQGLVVLNRLPTRVFAINAMLQREVAPLIRVPVHYTPNGVDTTFYQPAPAPHRPATDRLRVGWSGSLSNMGPEHRGFTNIIEPAVAALPGFELVTAIREERWRNSDEMLEFYHDIDLYVCASRSEGAPNTCLEAAACGIPVVTTRVGNMPELITDGENGLFFDGTVNGLIEKLSLLRDSPALRSAYGKRIRRSVEAWDWCHLAENYDRMFRAVLTNQTA